ncbi:hypothetical protein ACNAW0_26245 [Micromonospora sp. SL1-18]|uniref:hypothetical protein n=1 Tax=Micromonospora sp. SL1-18 TaxID=3399128 RepID=UPI003A4DF8DC
MALVQRDVLFSLAIVVGVALLVGFRPTAGRAVIAPGGYLWSKRLFSRESWQGAARVRRRQG